MSILKKIKHILDFLVNDKLLNVDNTDELVNYIFSNESLPAPLKDDEEETYINMLDTVNAEYGRSKLVEHNLRLVLYISKKFESAKLDLEDLVSVGSIGLVKAVDSYKKDKNIKLATYASRCIENEILMYLRKVNRTQNDVSLDEPLSIDNEGNELVLGDILPDNENSFNQIETKDQKKFLLSTIKNLDEREQEIIIMRYGLNGQEELTQKEVADIMNISQSYISRLEKKILKKLKVSMSKAI